MSLLLCSEKSMTGTTGIALQSGQNAPSSVPGMMLHAINFSHISHDILQTPMLKTLKTC